MLNAIIGKKLNMSARFDNNGRRVPVTLIEAGPCIVAAKKTIEKAGYNAAVLQLQKTKKRKINKEFKIENFDGLEINQKVSAADFKIGDLVKLTGISKGKGFAGVVKRWGFAGGPKTHGQSDRHRAPGSIGSGTTPGRVFKGKKMAGRMGNAQVTISSTEIVEINKDKNLLTVKGPIPGHFRSIVFIKKIGEAKSNFIKVDNQEETEIKKEENPQLVDSDKKIEQQDKI